MRDAIGATWVFAIFLTFIVLFTGYLAISVNYAKAFQIKSKIISMIEENEGYTSGGEIDEDIISYLISQGYSASGKCSTTINNDNVDDVNWEPAGTIDLGTSMGGNHNVCIYRARNVVSNNNDLCGNQSYYKVIAFFNFDLPVISYFAKFKVGGDTKLIHDFATTGCS